MVPLKPKHDKDRLHIPHTADQPIDTITQKKNNSEARKLEKEKITPPENNDDAPPESVKKSKKKKKKKKKKNKTKQVMTQPQTAPIKLETSQFNQDLKLMKDTLNKLRLHLQMLPDNPALFGTDFCPALSQFSELIMINAIENDIPSHIQQGITTLITQLDACIGRLPHPFEEHVHLKSNFFRDLKQLGYLTKENFIKTPRLCTFLEEIGRAHV